ncbi:hypothetical protein [Roseibacillus ishigakijimensis]|uniref:Uncharacterized protein n=1 Tax=Roseibacillus ishigakijimensis TaxID=454146 RepID=A0A934VMB3_9BACT|nr:hypothetical protein [Roseibacillus ishigakijimensis]MBK1833765.1 hypothetical protein [Roseibacillus ishigakijimensis]
MKNALALLLLPSLSLAGTYTLEVGPASGASFIELALPAATEVTFASHGGSFDASRQVLKWGPLLPTPDLLHFTLSGEPEGFSLVASSQNGGPVVTAATTQADGDDDGLPDNFEQLHGLDSFTADGHLDPDGDGLSSLAEFFLGTNPRDGTDALEFRDLQLTRATPFWTVSPRLPAGARLQSSSHLEPQSWLPVEATFVHEDDTTTIFLPATRGESQTRFFRLQLSPR